jgi:SWI/SNF-related matrix-associated actin-dependent regulator 1 of chromatin subfamily A
MYGRNLTMRMAKTIPKIKLRTKPRPFQKEGVRAIYDFKGRAILGDEQGLGKTLQALIWISKIPKHRPVIIVCPSTAKYGWQTEAHTHFRGMDIHVLEGRRPKRVNRLPGDICVLNYDILSSWLPAILKADPQVIIFDEFHYLQSPTSARTIAAGKAAFGAASVVGLSGTPITNELIGLWAPLAIIRPDLFPSMYRFGWRYTKPRKFRGWWKFKGARRKKELRRILLEECLIRRLKKDVAKELPPKTHKIVPLRIFGKALREYRQCANKKTFLNWLRIKYDDGRANRAKRSLAVARVGYLMRLMAELKMDLMAKWIEEWTLANPGKKLVCMTMHTKVINFLHKKFPNSVVINGKVRGIKREEAKRKFQNNTRVTYLFGNWKAAGVALTLTAAHHLVALDLPWTEGDLLQGQDRVHRIGQTKKVIIYYLMLMDTFEEKVFQILKDKTKVFSEIFDGKKASKDFNLLEALIEELDRE